jgi:hypothetical protein
MSDVLRYRSEPDKVRFLDGLSGAPGNPGPVGRADRSPFCADVCSNDKPDETDLLTDAGGGYSKSPLCCCGNIDDVLDDMFE